MTSAAPRPASLAEFLAIPEGERHHELIGGHVVEKAAPSFEHGDAQGGVLGAIRPTFQRPPGGGGHGGWWIVPEVEVLMATGDVVRPDVTGWRRDRHPSRPRGAPVRDARPDWICEVVSPSNASNDTVRKLGLYHRAGVPHYWVVDPRDGTLSVMRWAEPGYTTVIAAQRGDVVRAEPFDAVLIDVGTLFGDDPRGDE